MSATTLTPTPDAIGVRPVRPPKAVAPIPFSRLLKVELRKMFDTRAGFWLMLSSAILAVLATAAVIIFAPHEALTYGQFSSAIGIPLAVVLPIIAALSVSGEYSQRTNLTTFTLVPHRGRVVLAKFVLTVAVGVVAMFVALGVGAVGNVVGTAIAGIDPTWDISAGAFSRIVLANVIGMLMGFMLGTVLRSSAAAIVGYFVYSFVLPTIFTVLAQLQSWFRDVQPWVDVNYNVNRLFDNVPSGQDWAQLGVTSLIWLWVPLAVGVRALVRSEVK